MMVFGYANYDCAEDDEEDFGGGEKKPAVTPEDEKKPAIKIEREDMSSSGRIKTNFRAVDCMLSRTEKVKNIPKKEEMTTEGAKG